MTLKLFNYASWMVIPAMLGLASCSNASGTDQDHQDVRPTIRVVVAPATLLDSKSAFRYTGTIEPFRSIPLIFQSSGTINKVFVDEGDAVKAGDLLATLDEADLQNASKTTEASYLQALDAFNRLKPVYDNGSLPDVKWVEVRTGLAQSKAMYDLSLNNLRKASLRAPENGIIGSRNAEPGMNSLQVQSAFSLIDIKKVLVKVAVPEQEVPLMRKGSEAVVEVRALGSRILKGTIHSIGVMANTVSRTYDVKVVVDNPEQELRPGMVCDVQLHGASGAQLLSVPATAITTDQAGRPQVFLLDRKRMIVSVVPVVTGNYDGNLITILGGLKPGDEVVVTGKQKVYSSCKVEL